MMAEPAAPAVYPGPGGDRGWTPAVYRFLPSARHDRAPRRILVAHRRRAGAIGVWTS